jgi:hypothetical protein
MPILTSSPHLAQAEYVLTGYVLDAYVFGCDKSAVMTLIVAGQCVSINST